MGACLSPPDGPEDSGGGSSLPLFFHPYVKGSQIVMDETHCVAQRAATFHDGIVFSSRPVELGEKVTLKILKEDLKWHGGLRVGFTWNDPSLLEPSELPPFACPHLVRRGNTRACLLPEEYGAEGSVVSFWVDSHGRVFCSANEEAEASLLLERVSVASPLWAIVDVYGRAKAVQLLDPSSLPTETGAHSLLLRTPDQTTGELFLFGKLDGPEMQAFLPFPSRGASWRRLHRVFRLQGQHDDAALRSRQLLLLLLPEDPQNQRPVPVVSAEGEENSPHPCGGRKRDPRRLSGQDKAPTAAVSARKQVLPHRSGRISVSQENREEPCDGRKRKIG